MRRFVLITLALLAALLLPAQALALDEPDVVSDPPAAFEDVAAATIDLDEIPAAADEAPAPAAQASVRASNGSTASVAVVAPRGELPFTGPGDMVASVLLAVVLILAGCVLRIVPVRREDAA